jgi:hypothetical protein
MLGVVLRSSLSSSRLSPCPRPVRQEKSASVGRLGLPATPATLVQAVQLYRRGRGDFEY